MVLATTDFLSRFGSRLGANMKWLLFVAVVLSGCATNTQSQSASVFADMLRVNQIRTLQLVCTNGCRLVDISAAEQGIGEYYTLVETNCLGSADCVDGEGFIEYFVPSDERRRWSWRSNHYEQVDDVVLPDGVTFRHIEQTDSQALTRSYFVSEAHLYMLVHQPRVCSGEHGICYRLSHFEQLLFEIVR